MADDVLLGRLEGKGVKQLARRMSSYWHFREMDELSRPLLIEHVRNVCRIRKERRGQAGKKKADDRIL